MDKSEDTKNEIREKIWMTPEKEGVAFFPGARGRILNFKGSEMAECVIFMPSSYHTLDIHAYGRQYSIVFHIQDMF